MTFFHRKQSVNTALSCFQGHLMFSISQFQQSYHSTLASKIFLPALRPWPRLHHDSTIQKRAGSTYLPVLSITFVHPFLFAPPKFFLKPEGIICCAQELPGFRNRLTLNQKMWWICRRTILMKPVLVELSPRRARKPNFCSLPKLCQTNVSFNLYNFVF